MAAQVEEEETDAQVTGRSHDARMKMRVAAGYRYSHIGTQLAYIQTIRVHDAGLRSPFASRRSKKF
jgi:hypothetical protein